MANRTFNQFQGTLQKGVVTLFAKIGFDNGSMNIITEEVINAGTSPVTINPSNGFVGGTVADSGTGLYEIPLQDPYVRFLNASIVVQAGANSAVAGVQWFGSDAEVQSNTAPKLTLQFVDFAGVDVVPANDIVVLLSATFANSTAL